MPRPQAAPFTTGELLEYDVDVLTARAAKLTFAVLAPVGKGPAAELPVRARAQTYSFFSKIRRVKSQATSFLGMKDLRPRRMREDANEDGIVKTADVAFAVDGRHDVSIDWKRGEQTGRFTFTYAHDGLDLVGAIYYFRAIPLEVGQKVCFDVYALRRLWRLWGTVVDRERVSTPAGEFDTIHLAGEAARHDVPSFRREIHVWLSDDPRRIPVAALGAIDLGPVRATLTAVAKAGKDDLRSGRDRSLEW